MTIYDKLLLVCLLWYLARDALMEHYLSESLIWTKSFKYESFDAYGLLQ